MNSIFLNYPKCSTCRKAKKWLQDKGIEYIDRNIVDNNPSEDELAEWISMSDIEIKKLFNTSGKLYREMNLKEKVKLGDKKELIKILATDGMLVKRPLLIFGDRVISGFKEEVWAEVFGIEV